MYMDYVKLDDVIDFRKKNPKATDDLAQASIWCWIAEQLDRKEINDIVYNKDSSIATYNQICDRLRYAEEELECLDMYFDEMKMDKKSEWIWLPYSRIWRIKSFIKSIK